MSKSEFYYDIAFCIDKTKNNLDQFAFISEFIDSFKNQLSGYLRSYGIKVKQLRIKIIEFGDLNLENSTIVDHGFYDMSTQFSDFSDLLFKIKIDGASSERGYSNGLEALYHAFNSDWTDLSDKDGRQCVVLFSKNAPFALGELSEKSGYPTGIDGLKSCWENGKFDNNKKLLALFCPMGSGERSYLPLMEWDKVMAIDTQDINDYNNDFLMETLLIDLI